MSVILFLRIDHRPCLWWLILAYRIGYFLGVGLHVGRCGSIDLLGVPEYLGYVSEIEVCLGEYSPDGVLLLIFPAYTSTWLKTF